jgi:hypothetical protein
LAICTQGACNKFGKKVALWSTTIGDGNNFMRVTRLLLKKLNYWGRLELGFWQKKGNEITSLLATSTYFMVI